MLLDSREVGLCYLRLADIEIQLVPAGTIAGRIFDRDGEPFANVTVEAIRQTGLDPSNRHYLPGLGQLEERVNQNLMITVYNAKPTQRAP
jgi:hypothetical protein